MFPKWRELCVRIGLLLCVWLHLHFKLAVGLLLGLHSWSLRGYWQRSGPEDPSISTAPVAGSQSHPTMGLIPAATVTNTTSSSNLGEKETWLRLSGHGSLLRRQGRKSSGSLEAGLLAVPHSIASDPARRYSSCCCVLLPSETAA